MAARFPYYHLADSPEGMKKEAEVTGKVPPPHPTDGDLRKGFVYRRVPHITLKSIANNEDIDLIFGPWEPKIKSVQEKLNKLLKQQWEEWQVPRLPSEHMTEVQQAERWKELKKIGIEKDSKAEALLSEFWRLRRERQREIDACIAKNADVEYLYDQPYEDTKTVRVTGPFTVESLSPHRILASDSSESTKSTPSTASTTNGPSQSAETADYARVILDNLKSAGVQNTRKNERLKFERLEPYAGQWIQAEGHYTEKDGKPRRAAISIGPEHGTVGPEQVKEAAKEAVRGAGFDLLIVLGFAFDAHASETAKEFSPEEKGAKKGIIAEGTKQYGRLPVLLARMNPDLAMGDELLKKTGAGNLFMIFGEPDIQVVSEEWLVNRGERRVMPLEFYQILSGARGLAEINELGEDDLRGYTVLAQRGEVWANFPDEKGCGVGSGKHRGGAGEEHDRRISAIARHGAGFAGGIGDPDRFVRELGFSDGNQFRKAVDRLRRSEPVTFRASEVALQKPLTTRHYSLVTLRGLDIYDPTTGQVRSSSTDDIACWFIDTNYNGESFFVRHAYFTGGDEPYEKLKRALRAEIDEAAWSALYSTTSRPFPKPETGKIAVKVINHYGDEVLKVYGV